MSPLQREDIQLFSKYGNLSDEQVEQLLNIHVHRSKEQWQQFVRILLLTLAIGFSAAGLIFFFAYNWAELHKFAKLGLVQGLIIVTVTIAVFSKYNTTIKNIFLSGASVLVGALFAVFGQIYQSGANAYDFFLGWTVFVSIWVLVSNFAALWLLFLVLLNVTITLYIDQALSSWKGTDTFLVLFYLNAAALVIAALFGKAHSPVWFLYTLAIAVTVLVTIGLIVSLYDDYSSVFLSFLISSLVFYALSLYYGINRRNTFYIALPALSAIFFVTACIFKNSFDLGVFFIAGIFVISAITFCVKMLIDLQKKWQHENKA